MLFENRRYLMDDTRLSQAAALLVAVLTHQQPVPTSLEQIDTQTHRLAHQVGRQAAERYVASRVAQAEAARPVCACGTPLQAERRCGRAVLFLTGLIRFRLRRYRCPRCGTWRCPSQEAFQLAPRQRMTRTVQAAIREFGLSWSFAVAAGRLGRSLPGVAVSSKTVERVTQGGAAQVQAQEDLAAQRCQEPDLPVGEPREPPREAPAPRVPFVCPERVYVGLDGVLVRGRHAKEWLEVQVGSLWSAWRDLPERKTPRRVITDRTVVARAAGWEQLGEQVWRVFVQRGGLRRPTPEVVVLGDGAAGIRSLWELHFPGCLALLDPWHLWEKVNDLVVVPRMKNGKMHWSRAGANAVALLRAHVLNDPEGWLLPT